jgi:hypothetical protein
MSSNAGDFSGNTGLCRCLLSSAANSKPGFKTLFPHGSSVSNCSSHRDGRMTRYITGPPGRQFSKNASSAESMG